MDVNTLRDVVQSTKEHGPIRISNRTRHAVRGYETVASASAAALVKRGLCVIVTNEYGVRMLAHNAASDTTAPADTAEPPVMDGMPYRRNMNDYPPAMRTGDNRADTATGGDDEPISPVVSDEVTHDEGHSRTAPAPVSPGTRVVTADRIRQTFALSPMTGRDKCRRPHSLPHDVTAPLPCPCPVVPSPDDATVPYWAMPGIDDDDGPRHVGMTDHVKPKLSRDGWASKSRHHGRKSKGETHHRIAWQANRRTARQTHRRNAS